jgi:hypothetical protein
MGQKDERVDGDRLPLDTPAEQAKVDQLLAAMQDVFEDAAIAKQVRARDARDNGERVSVDDLAAELGIDLDDR